MPELLGGRVKTLHPRIHAAILARRDRADDSAALDEHGIEPFDLVCVNLYPFEEVTSRRAVGEQDAVELIDIGGPAMLRAAAKNFAHVAPVPSPERYDEVLEEVRERGDLLLETRRRLAGETFAMTAAYESAIVASYDAVVANASFASERRSSRDTERRVRSSSMTTSYCSGLQTAITCSKFFAAARSIDGPPTSIISTASASVTPCFATACSNG